MSTLPVNWCVCKIQRFSYMYLAVCLDFRFNYFAQDRSPGIKTQYKDSTNRPPIKYITGHRYINSSFKNTSCLFPQWNNKLLDLVKNILIILDSPVQRNRELCYPPQKIKTGTFCIYLEKMAWKIALTFFKGCSATWSNL